MNDTPKPSTPHAMTGPPLARLYPVEPAGVQTTIPSQRTEPTSSPSRRYDSSATRSPMRRCSETSLKARCERSSIRTSIAGRSSRSNSPRNARAKPSDISSGSTVARKPTSPKFTANTGTPVRA
jgi:hypothetical protein